MIIKILIWLGIITCSGIYGFIKFMEQQEDKLFGENIYKKSKDEELYEEVNPIWKEFHGGNNDRQS